MSVVNIILGVLGVVGFAPTLWRWARGGGAPSRDDLRAIGAALMRAVLRATGATNRDLAWATYAAQLDAALAQLGWTKSRAVVQETSLGALPVLLVHLADVAAGAAAAVNHLPPPPPDPRLSARTTATDPDGTRHVELTIVGTNPGGTHGPGH